MRGLLFALLLATGALMLTGCSRSACECGPKLSYGDSIVYLRGSDYTIRPLQARTGTYTAFPGNLTIDPATGAITVTQRDRDGESQTGMWYRITYRSADGRHTDSTMVLLSGLTYVDRFYHLSENDSIISPIYNGNAANALPSGNYNLTRDDKLAIDPTNGQINIRESIRRGFFNSQMNSSWKVATVRYSLNDGSAGAANAIDLVLYYYRTLADVPRNVSRLMQAHQRMTLNLPNLQPLPDTGGEIDNHLPGSLSMDKPRPPCVIIIGK